MARKQLGVTPSNNPDATTKSYVDNGLAGKLTGGLTSTATANSTTTLTSSSNRYQLFTGNNNQTLQMPDTSTLTLGVSYVVLHNGSGDITVKASDNSTIFVVSSYDDAEFTCISTSDTSSGGWFTNQFNVGAISGKDVTFNNSFSFSGTDGTSFTFPATSDTIVALTATQTLTNKRVTPRAVAVTSSATPAINTDNGDLFNLTSLAANITSMSASTDTPAGQLTGTPTDGQKFMLRIKDNGTSRTITWGPKFQSSGIATLPTATPTSKTMTLGFTYDSAAAKWTLLAVDSVGY